MDRVNLKVYGYRWIVLLSYMPIIAVNQIVWITFAPVTDAAASFYSVSTIKIGLLSMSFMMVYIIVSIPASWVIDTFGFKIGVGIGSLLTAVFALIRGIFAYNYTLVLLSQIGVAIGQPFILNALTKVAARWFPVRERATASGLGTLAIYFGIVVGMALTPYLVISEGFHKMLFIYGIVSILTAAVFIIFAKEKPPTPASPSDKEERSMVFDGLKTILHKKDFLVLMAIFFVGLGVFNGVATWIEEIIKPRGFTITQAGITGGLMVIGGIIGAAVMPFLSDHFHKRIPFFLLALTCSIPGLTGITFANSYMLLLTSSFMLGFFLLSAGPIGFQYGAEIAFPAPEGTSTGILLLMGQISGIIFIFGIDSFKSPLTGLMTMPLLVIIGLMALMVILSTRLKESPLILEEVIE